MRRVELRVYLVGVTGTARGRVELTVQCTLGRFLSSPLPPVGRLRHGVSGGVGLDRNQSIQILGSWGWKKEVRSSFLCVPIRCCRLAHSI